MLFDFMMNFIKLLTFLLFWLNLIFNNHVNFLRFLSGDLVIDVAFKSGLISSLIRNNELTFLLLANLFIRFVVILFTNYLAFSSFFLCKFNLIFFRDLFGFNCLFLWFFFNFRFRLFNNFWFWLFNNFWFWFFNNFRFWLFYNFRFWLLFRLLIVFTLCSTSSRSRRPIFSRLAFDYFCCFRCSFGILQKMLKNNSWKYIFEQSKNI